MPALQGDVDPASQGMKPRTQEEMDAFSAQNIAEYEAQYAKHGDPYVAHVNAYHQHYDPMTDALIRREKLRKAEGKTGLYGRTYTVHRGTNEDGKHFEWQEEI